MKPLRVLVLVHAHLVPPEVATPEEARAAEWRTEWDVVSTLRAAGHELRVIGVHDDLSPIRQAVEAFQPDIAFNLIEAFDGVTVFDQNVVSYLELLRLPYTGCNPRGLMLARDKSLAKKLLAYHRIPVPDFTVIPRHRRVQLPRSLRFPLIVKSLTFEASVGISQASVVATEEQLQKRVQFVHDSLGTAALVEQFIDGRELYVGIVGNARLEVFPVWEMSFARMPEHSWRIATERVKWNVKYQQRHGIETGPADLPEPVLQQVRRLAHRTYRALEITGYARIDLRLNADGRVFVLEANPNPQIANGEDFAASAARAGWSYDALLGRLLTCGLQWQPARNG